MLQIDDDAMAALKAYSWPGNVRHLENVIERAVVIAEGSSLGIAELPPEITGKGSFGLFAHDLDEIGSFESMPSGISAEKADRDRWERQRLLRALASASGNKAEAARALGLARSTLISRLKKHGLG